MADAGRQGYRMGPAGIFDSMLSKIPDDAFSGEHLGRHTEELVTCMELDRATRARRAAQHGRSDAETADVAIKDRNGDQPFTIGSWGIP